MKKAVGYIRVSTQEQADSGLSLAAQRQKIISYAEVNDLQLIDVIEDAGVSGKTTTRDGLQMVLNAVNNKVVDAVVVLKLDRLSRSVLDILKLIQTFEKSDVAFHSIHEKIDTKTAIGKFFLNVTASFAQMERDIIAERTSLALQEKRRQNKLAGNVPYGWDLAEDGETLTENPIEQSAIKRIQQLAAKGVSLRKIGAYLDKKGFKPKRGTRWHPKVIATLAMSRAS